MISWDIIIIMPYAWSAPAKASSAADLRKTRARLRCKLK